MNQPCPMRLAFVVTLVTLAATLAAVPSPAPAAVDTSERPRPRERLQEEGDPIRLVIQFDHYASVLNLTSRVEQLVASHAQSPVFAAAGLAVDTSARAPAGAFGLAGESSRTQGGASGALQLPTDFVPIICLRDCKAAAADLVRVDAGIKRVFPNSWLRHQLQAFDGPASTKRKANGDVWDDPFQSTSDCNGSAKHQAMCPTLSGGRQMLMRGAARGHTLQHAYNLKSIWAAGTRGQGVRVAVLDSGMDCKGMRKRFQHLATCTDWTMEGTVADGVGHGTFVAGMLAGSFASCGGIAPDIELHVLKVFDSTQRSLTSWFLDALNYVLFLNVDLVNFSIGGPDFLDKPFVDKVREVSANGITVVSASGNDGPGWGTLMNPADQSDVISVGGLTADGTMIAEFSARGMTLWEAGVGYGRVKPDVVVPAEDLLGMSVGSNCVQASGTSVACPIVTAALALVLSAVPKEHRGRLRNPATLKQILHATAKPLQAGTANVRTTPSIFEQGAGRLDLGAAVAYAKNLVRSNLEPVITSFPSAIDWKHCPLNWPICAQPLFPGKMPVAINFTILNGFGVMGRVVKLPRWEPSNRSAGQRMSVNVVFETSGALFPWSGSVGTFLTVKDNRNALTERDQHNGSGKGASNTEGDFLLRGDIVVDVATIVDRVGMVNATVRIPLVIWAVLPAPPRQRRLLWDQHHNVPYPNPDPRDPYIPRDSLEHRDSLLDWRGDHLHTTFSDFFSHMTSQGFFVDVVTGPLDSLDVDSSLRLQDFGALVIVDPEAAFSTGEVAAIYQAVVKEGLSLVVFGDWFDSHVLKEIGFFDSNTQRQLTAWTGGANVPELNKLLGPFGISLSTDMVLSGDFAYGYEDYQFLSGSSIAEFPAGGRLLFRNLRDLSTEHPAVWSRLQGDANSQRSDWPILGLLQTTQNDSEADNISSLSIERTSIARSGRVVVYGDSACLETTRSEWARHSYCASLVLDTIRYALTGEESQTLGLELRAQE